MGAKHLRVKKSRSPQSLHSSDQSARVCRNADPFVTIELMINFLILFLVLLILAYLTNYFLMRSFLGYKYRFFVAPGVILHELSHAFACLICGAKIIQISFFNKDGGLVKHEKPIIPVLGPILISLAPLVVSIILFYFLAKALKFESSIDLSATFFNLQSISKAIDLTSWRNLLIIYLLLSTAVTMTPSWQDLINMLAPLIFLLGIFYLLVRFTAINFSRFEFIFIKLAPILNLTIFILLGCLLISLLFYLLTKLMFKR